MNHPLDTQPALPAKRKRTLNPKLTSEDNVHEDAVKRRKAQQLTNQRPTPGTSKEKVRRRASTPPPSPRRASTPPPSVVDFDNDTEMVAEDSESSDSSDSEPSSVEIEETVLQEETDEQELGKLDSCTSDDAG